MMYGNYLKYKKNLKKEQQQRTNLHDQSIEKIKSHAKTKVIKYEDYKEAFDYVAERFPDADVKEAVVYQCTRSILDKAGYKDVGGFFSRLAKIVVIPDSVNPARKAKSIWETVQAEMSIDEVLVHELCHYVSNKSCDTWKTLQIEEEFAYGNSIDYLRAKGHSDDHIIKLNFMPYLMMIMRRKHAVTHDPTRTKEQEKALFDTVYADAYKLGQEIIRIWDDKKNPTDTTPMDFEIFRQDVGLDMD